MAWSPTLGYAKVDPEVASVTEAAAKVFESTLGCKVEAADPGFESPWSMFSVLWTMSYALRLRTFLPEWGNRMDPDLVTLIKGFERLGPAEEFSPLNTWPQPQTGPAPTQITATSS